MNLYQLDLGGHDLLLRDVSAYEYLALRQILPMGLLPFYPDERTCWGLVLQCGDSEVGLVRFDTGQVQPENVDGMLTAVRMLAARALPGYMQNGFHGVMMPLAYAYAGQGPRDVGLCCLVAPDPAGPEAQVEPKIAHIDSELGRGASRMAYAFLAAFAEQWQQEIGDKLTLLKLDVRPRLQVGSVVFDLLVCGPDVFYAGRYPEENQGLLEPLAAAGVPEVVLLPSIPLAIDPDQLATATGK